MRKAICPYQTVLVVAVADFVAQVLLVGTLVDEALGIVHVTVHSGTAGRRGV